MPTAAKLVSAILMGALGYYAANLLAAHLPEEVPANWLRPLSAVFGVIVGWRFLGKRVRGSGIQSGIGLGVTASAAVVLMGLVWFSGYEMVRRAMRLAYGGNPFEALQDMVQIALDFTIYLGNGDVLAALLGGGAVVGIVADMVARRWS